MVVFYGKLLRGCPDSIAGLNLARNAYSSQFFYLSQGELVTFRKCEFASALHRAGDV